MSRAESEQQLPPSDRTPEPETEPAPETVSGTDVAVAAMGGMARIPGDVVNRATADLPDNQRSAVRRLHAFYTDHALSLGELEPMTGIDRTTLTQVFRGKYPSKLDGIVQKIERFFDLEERRSSSRKLEFVVTKLAQKIGSVCELAWEMSRIAFLFGESQIGKSAALKRWNAEHNHGATIYVEVPDGGGLMDFLSNLAKKLRMSPHQRRTDLRRRVIEAFDERMLLIVDEAHRCVPVPGSQGTKGIKIIEFIRALHDEAGCGVVICATNVFRQEMEKGQMSKLLEQTRRRRCAAVQLPDVSSKEDLALFARHYNLPPATGDMARLQARINAEEGLGMWLTIFRLAIKVANETKSTMTWAHVQSAYAGLLKLEGRDDVLAHGQ